MIEYRYLDMDNKVLYTDRNLYKTAMEDRAYQALEVAFSNQQHNQVLIAGGQDTFTEYEAISLCRNLCGLDVFGEKLTDN